MYTIYALADPRDNLVHYVGLTDNVYKRFVAHITCSGNNYDKNASVHAAKAANIMISMSTLEQTEDLGLARVREVYWINHYRMLQHPLTNIQHANLRFVKNMLVRSPREVQRNSHPRTTALITPIIPDSGAKAEDIDLNTAIIAYNTRATSRYQLAKMFG
jgi:hypothetical protein